MIEELLREISEFQDKTFPQATPQSAANHLFYEALELKKTPENPEEMADVFLLLAAIAHLAGVDLLAAVRAKLEVNKKRQWGKVNSEGFVEHVREKNSFAGLERRILTSTDDTTLPEVVMPSVPEDEPYAMKDWEIRMRLTGELPG